MKKKNLLLIALICAGCHQGSNDDQMQAHEQKALDILENYMKSGKEESQ